MDAEVVRVVDGNTLRWFVNRRPAAPNRQRFGVHSGQIMSARSPSQMTNTARFIGGHPLGLLPVFGELGERGRQRQEHPHRSWRHKAD